jgi:hypothetical protein
MPYALGIMKKGRPKGYSPYASISYEELGDWVGRKTKVLVSKKWLDALIEEPTEPDPKPQLNTESVAEEEQPKIQYNLTQF